MTTKLRTFLILWSGQVVSIFGTSMTGFALGVWVFQTTGSVTRFALISFSSAFPAIVLLPASGIIVDRFNRLRVMIWGDLGAALGTVAIAALLWLGYLEIWHIYVLMAFARPRCCLSTRSGIDASKARACGVLKAEANAIRT
jgi:MFS family permease